MRRLLFIAIIALFLIKPVNAVEFTAPPAPASAQEYLSEEPETFGEGLMLIVREAIARFQPALASASKVCIAIIVMTLLLSLLQSMPGSVSNVAQLVGTVSVAATLFQTTDSLIRLGSETVNQISEYGKLLLPVLTAAVAAQGGITTSTALYTGTVMFDAVLCHLISVIVVPAVYIYLCLSTAANAISDNALNKIRDFIKWVATWSLKLILYIFTGYISITGVISGTTDAAAVKATKLAISGVVPVVGGILSDASETVLVSAGIMKNSVGVYGLLAAISIWIGPFIQIGAQYLMLKITAAVCGVLADKQPTKLVQDFSTAMGMILAMTGTICMILLISIVCFMKGAG